MRVPEQAQQRNGRQTAQRPDVATTVVLTMRQLGIVGLPRNYELFYEAITAGSKELTDTLSSLGNRPTQKQLDEVVRKFLKRRDDALVSEAHSEVSHKLDEILTLLKKERHSMETYGKILDETSNGLRTRQDFSRDFLEKIISVTATATKTSLDHRDKTVLSIDDKSSELQNVRLKLEEYKRLAETDALTQLSNRRAFDRRLTDIFDTNRNIAFSALMLIDIDNFKTINDRFGHPVGDRIIQIVGNIIRSTVKSGCFVARTGGEEFAVILEGSGEEATTQIAEDLRQAVVDAPFVNVSTGINYGPVTISVGTCMATQAQNPDDLYVKADRALYSSKASGRNRVTRFSSLTENSFVKNWLLYRSQ